MVRNTCSVVFMIASYLVSAGGALGSAGIESVRVASATTIRVKPCAPAFVILEVTLDEAAGKHAIRDVSKELARRTLINGREYAFELRNNSMNPVAVFLVDELWARTLPDAARIVPVVVMVYWNIEDQDYVFNVPGLYHIKFHPEGNVNVVVEEPSDTEREMIVQMKDMGIACASFVMEQGGKDAGPTVSRVENMVERYTDTAYSEYLSISLGLNKLRRSHYGKYGRDDFDMGSFAAERMVLAKKYLEPFCTETIQSPFESAATYRFAVELLDELRFNEEPSNSQRTAKRGRAIRFLRAVADSPFSIANRFEATSRLKKLTENGS